MSEPKKSALEHLVSVLEAAQFNDGSLDLSIHGSEGSYQPVPVKVYLPNLGDLCAELHGIANARQAVAGAIRESKRC